MQITKGTNFVSVLCFCERSLLKNRFGEDSEIHRDVGGALGAGDGLVMGQQWQFSATKIALLEVLLHGRSRVRRQVVAPERQQGR